MKIRDITEARSAIYSRSNGKNVVYTTTKKASMPFLSVYDLDGKYRTVSITKEGAAMYRDLVAHRHETGGFTNEVHRTIYQTIVSYVIGQDAEFEKFPLLFDVTNHTDDESFGRELLVKHKMDAGIIQKKYGIMPSSGKEFMIGDTQIIPVATPTKATRQRIEKFVATARSVLSVHQLENLLAVRVQVSNLAGRAAAKYDHQQDIILLSMKTLGNGQADKTVVHELMHRWDHTVGLGDMIDAKYREIVGAGHNAPRKPDVSMGDDLLFIGDHKQLKGTTLVVTDVSSKFVTCNVFKEHVLYSTVKFRPALFSTGDVVKLDGTPIIFLEPDDWFVSKYATTNAKEFFAELASHWLMGFQTSPIAEEWLNSLPRP